MKKDIQPVVQLFRFWGFAGFRATKRIVGKISDDGIRL